MLILNVLQSILSIMIMVSIGYILTEKKWLDEKISSLFSRIIINISLPSIMIYNMMSSFDKEGLINTLGGIIVPFMAILLTYFISIPLSNILKVKKGRKGLFRALFTFANTIFIGLPVNIALFGEKSIPLATLYYIANTTIFWTIGLYGIKKDGTAQSTDNKLISLTNLKRIFSPILGAYLLSIILILLQIKLPRFILDTTKYFGNLTTPLSMLIMGIIIHSIDLKKIRFDRDMAAILVGRFILTPALVFIIFHFFVASSILMKKVFIIEAAMPVMTTIAIVGRAYDADHQYATVHITMTLLISLFVIPIYMFLMSFL